LYGYETWSLNLREEHRLRVFENRENTWTKREKVAGCWRRLHKEELQTWCSSPNIIIMTKSRRIWEDMVVGDAVHIKNEKCIKDVGGKT
jgi:hypothetical protein